MKQKVTEERLAVGGLEEEVEYRFCVRAVTVGAGGAAEARVRTGPQAGSPSPPRALRLRPDPAALHLRWDNAASGRGPLLGYYIEARKKGIVPPSNTHELNYLHHLLICFPSIILFYKLFNYIYMFIYFGIVLYFKTIYFIFQCSEGNMASM